MKRDLSHLPDRKQRELGFIVETIRKHVAAEMIILFGSHARGDWVEDHETGYMSDYDVLVVVRNTGDADEAGSQWEAVKRRIDEAFRDRVYHNIIAHAVDHVNHELRQGQYFFTDIVREGIMLHDSGRHKLAEPVALDNAERKRLAEEDHAKWFRSAEVFYVQFENALKIDEHNNAAFQLHQATERFYTTLLLVHSRYKPRTHDIVRLGRRAAAHVPEVGRVFPRATERERKCFELLKRAYVDARYKDDYAITREELEHLAARVRELRTVVEDACGKKIESLAADDCA